jgi:hypothetical protein
MKKQLVIFWIEDNPIQREVLDGDGTSYPDFDIPGGKESLLSIKLFQHPMEVREYLEMIFLLGRSKHAHTLGETCPDGLPDIIVFDYKLSDNFGTSSPNALLYHNPKQLQFLRDHSAAYALKRAFPDLFAGRELFMEREDVLAGNYSSDLLKKELNASTDIQCIDDEFGLFCGISILREFREYISVALPATFTKSDKSAMTINSLFYEWLNGYDIKQAIEREDRNNKSWTNIIGFALPHLRRQVENQLRKGSISLSLEQLEKHADGVTLGEQEKVLSMRSDYGKRDIPLDALFLTESDDRLRGKKIKEWAARLIDTLPLSDIMQKAMLRYKILWQTFLDRFEQRIILSEYTYKINELDEKERLLLANVRLALNVDPVTDEIGREHQCSIQTVSDLRDPHVIRLTVLLIVTRAAIDMAKELAEGSEDESRAAHFDGKFTQLTAGTYFNILFPVVNFGEDLFLPMNIDDSVKRDKAVQGKKLWLSRNLSIPEAPVQLKDLFRFDQWITPQERQLLQSVFYDDREYFPAWTS